MDLFLRKKMVSDPETFDVSKYGKLTEMTQIKYRFGSLVGFSHNIANQTGFENLTGNTNYKVYIHVNFWFCTLHNLPL